MLMSDCDAKNLKYMYRNKQAMIILEKLSESIKSALGFVKLYPTTDVYISNSQYQYSFCVAYVCLYDRYLK